MRYPFLNLADANAPYLTEINRRVAAVIGSGRYVGGPEVEEFERQLAMMTGTEYAVGVSNGLDALRLILRAYIELGRMEKGDEVIVPANTYIASVLAISDAGLVPVLAEPSERTANLDTARLGEYLTGHTRAIMDVHLYGRACWDGNLARFAGDHGLLVIEDNAQAIGAEVITPLGARRTGSLGDAAAFSFYPTKNIGAMGDAGAVTTSDPDLAATVRALANYGAPSRYNNEYIGFNCRLDPVQAAVLNAKLPFTDEENDRRRRIAGIYLHEISNPLVTLPAAPSHPLSMVWHQFVVNAPRRRELCSWLDDNSVGWDIHYATPPHLQPCYRNLIQHGPLPVTGRLADTCLSLPIGRSTSADDARAIAAIVNAFRPDE